MPHTPESLLAAMTLEEKVAQLLAVKPWQIVDERNRLDPQKAEQFLRQGIGQISAPSGTLRPGC